MTRPSFTLRPATDSDYELMWRIQRTAIGPYVDATFGWDASTQRRYFDEHFDHRKHQIIQVHGQDAGFLSFQPLEDHVYLGNLALLPPHQNRGVGTEVLYYVVGEAEGRGLEVRLQVLKSNPARAWYERRGFELVGESETHFRMLRKSGVR